MTPLRRLLCTTAVATVLLPVAAGPALADVDLGVFSGPVRFEAPDGTTLDLGDRRYVGTVEARVAQGGITLVDELSFDAYLEGLAEVPVSWHPEALRAQVIAARTYVWWELSQGLWTDRGYDICATQACQVFRGRDVVEADGEGRWTAAVADTSGLVLLDAADEPMLARYSSSNGGRSEPNVEVFPDDGDFPYLQAVDDPFDAVSPFHRWEVRFPPAVLDELFARGETLSAVVPVADVRLVEVPQGVDLVAVTGVDGGTVEVTTAELRSFVNRVAPDVDPEAYPPPRPDRPDRRAPQTFLSPLFDVTFGPDGLVVAGRGFGHGVGMSQYGALGRAEAGQTAEEIVAAYYGGTLPTAPDDLPSSVRVGLAEELQQVSVLPSGPVTVRVGDVVLTDRGLGGWRVEARSDRTVRLLAPDGYGAPLVVDPTSTSRTAPWATEVVQLETVVNKHVELELELRDTDGAVLSTTPLGVAEPGRHTVDWSLDAPDGGLLVPGSYEVVLVAIDEEGTRAGGAVPLRVRAPSAATTASLLPDTVPSGLPDGRAAPWAWPLAAAVGAALGAAVGLRRRSDPSAVDLPPPGGPS